jgi:uridine phosphorylase
VLQRGKWFRFAGGRYQKFLFFSFNNDDHHYSINLVVKQPILKDHRDSKALLTPEALIDWKRARGILQIPVPPRIIILTTQGGLIDSKKRYVGNKWLKGLIGKHLCIDTQSGIYLSSGWGIGSPGMIALCEEFRVLGATSFSLVGVAGRLSEDIHEGEIMVANSAISEEGTSRHYPGKSDQAIPCSENVLKKLSEFRLTKFVSTDAPYRETPELVERWKKSGATMVDMETSALYSFAHYYGCEACSIAVGADSLYNNTWSRVADMNTLYKKQVEALEAVIRLIKKV